MRLPASEKLEIIRLVEKSHLPVRRTLDKLGIHPSTFYHWVDRYRQGGVEALEDRPSRPDRVWNRIPDAIRQQIIDLALEVPEFSDTRRDRHAGPREHCSSPHPHSVGARRAQPLLRRVRSLDGQHQRGSDRPPCG